MCVFVKLYKHEHLHNCVPYIVKLLELEVKFSFKLIDYFMLQIEEILKSYFIQFEPNFRFVK